MVNDGLMTRRPEIYVRRKSLKTYTQYAYLLTYNIKCIGRYVRLGLKNKELP